MTDAAPAASQVARPPRSWSDVGLAALMVILTPILKQGGMDIMSALISAVSAIVLTSWAMYLPHHLKQVGQLGRALARLAQQEAALDNRPHGTSHDGEGDLPRIVPR